MVLARSASGIPQSVHLYVQYLVVLLAARGLNPVLALLAWAKTRDTYRALARISAASRITSFRFWSCLDLHS